LFSGYNRTIFPNILGQSDQEEANVDANQYALLPKVSKLFSVFFKWLRSFL